VFLIVSFHIPENKKLLSRHLESK